MCCSASSRLAFSLPPGISLADTLALARAKTVSTAWAACSRWRQAQILVIVSLSTAAMIKFLHNFDAKR